MHTLCTKIANPDCFDRVMYIGSFCPRKRDEKEFFSGIYFKMPLSLFNKGPYVAIDQVGIFVNHPVAGFGNALDNQVIHVCIQSVQVAG